MKSSGNRKVIAVVLLILIGAIWQIVAFILDTPRITNYPPKGAHIIALGDSLTVGVGASSVEYSLISQLEKRLNVTIVNKGVSGNTTRAGLERLSADVLANQPNIVIVLLGGNDYLQRIPEDETFANLRKIITGIQAQGGVVLLLGVRGGILNDKFDDNFEALAEETGSLYVPDVLDGIFGNSIFMSDAIHPNDKGYEKIVDKVAPSLLMLISGIPSITEQQ